MRKAINEALERMSFGCNIDITVVSIGLVANEILRQNSIEFTIDNKLKYSNELIDDWVTTDIVHKDNIKKALFEAETKEV